LGGTKTKRERSRLGEGWFKKEKKKKTGLGPERDINGRIRRKVAVRLPRKTGGTQG